MKPGEFSGFNEMTAPSYENAVILVPMVGLEPTPHRWERILSPSRLPFHHIGKQKRLYRISAKKSTPFQKIRFVV